MRSILLTLLSTLPTLPALAASYPRTVIDLAGREVSIPREPQRILLQDSNDLLALAVLDRANPVARVAAWNNGLRGSDPSLWRLITQRWPEAEKVPTLSFSSGGEIDIEAVIRSHPDLIVAKLETRPAVDNSVLGEVLERLGIPLVYVDSENDPLHNVPRSVALLGEALDRRPAAHRYVAAYRQRLADLQAKVRGLPVRRVFVEARAGQAGSGSCCHTQGDSAFGQLIQGLGSVNLGSRLLVGDSGDVALETLIRSKPDVYLMTGTQRMRQGVGAIPFGYGISRSRVDAAMAQLVDRPGFRHTRRDDRACTYGLYHQFYNSVFNIMGLEYLMTQLWPETFENLDPDRSYRQWIARFTDLPDAAFVFSARSCGEPPT